MLQHSLTDPPGLGDRLNLIEPLLLRHVRQGRGETAALEFESTTITYAALARAVAYTRELLQAEGIGRGDRVAIVLADSPAFVYLLLAAISLGAIAVPLNPKHNAQDVQDMLSHVGAKAVFIQDATDWAQSVASSCAASMRVVITDLTMRSILPESRRSAFEDFVPEVTIGADIVYLLFSSGTTGRPKAILRRQADIPWTAAAFAEDVLNMRQTDRVLAVPKLTFGYALAGNLMFSLLYGATAILIPQTSSVHAMRAAIRHYSPSIFLAQPRMLAELMECVTDAAELSCIRTTVSAGDVLPDAVRRSWLDRTGMGIIDGFGSTEAGHIFLCNTHADHPADAVGRVLRGYETKIVTEDGMEAADGSPGRLCIRGASVSSGYWNDPERTQCSFVDDWYISDDVFIRRDGLHFYAGRRDDMIKTGCGEWVAPHYLESVLRNDAGVLDCAVVGTHDERGIIRVKAYIVRSATAESDNALATRLSQLPLRHWPQLEHMRIHMIELIEAIPRSVNGKIQRHRLAPKTLTEFAYQC